MAATRWSIAMACVFALCGCDRVFGLEGREEPVPIDAVLIDATVATVVSLSVPGLLFVGGEVTITATVEGAPGTDVTCVFSTNRGGSFSDSDVLVTLDAVTGRAMVSAVYTAPSTAGDVTVQAAVGVSTMSSTFTVRDFTLVGNDTTFGGGSYDLLAGVLMGTQVTLPPSFSPTQIGVRTNAPVAGVRAHFGLYDGSRNLLAETGIVTLAGERSVHPLVIGQTLAQGPYWIVGMFDRNVMVYSTAITPDEGYRAGSMAVFSAPMPAVLPVGTSQPARFAYFLLGID